MWTWVWHEEGTEKSSVGWGRGVWEHGEGWGWILNVIFLALGSLEGLWGEGSDDRTQAVSANFFSLRNLAQPLWLWCVPTTPYCERLVPSCQTPQGASVAESARVKALPPKSCESSKQECKGPANSAHPGPTVSVSLGCRLSPACISAQLLRPPTPTPTPPPPLCPCSSTPPPSSTLLPLLHSALPPFLCFLFYSCSPPPFQRPLVLRFLMCQKVNSSLPGAVRIKWSVETPPTTMGAPPFPAGLDHSLRGNPALSTSQSAGRQDAGPGPGKWACRRALSRSLLIILHDHLLKDLLWTLTDFSVCLRKVTHCLGN